MDIFSLHIRAKRQVEKARELQDGHVLLCSDSQKGAVALSDFEALQHSASTSVIYHHHGHVCHSEPSREAYRRLKCYSVHSEADARALVLMVCLCSCDAGEGKVGELEPKFQHVFGCDAAAAAARCMQNYGLIGLAESGFQFGSQRISSHRTIPSRDCRIILSPTSFQPCSLHTHTPTPPSIGDDRILLVQPEFVLPAVASLAATTCRHKHRARRLPRSRIHHSKAHSRTLIDDPLLRSRAYLAATPTPNMPNVNRC